MFRVRATARALYLKSCIMEFLTPSIKNGLSPQSTLEDRLHMLSHYFHLYIADLAKIDLFHPESYETQQAINLLSSATAAANAFSSLYKYGQAVGYLTRQQDNNLRANLAPEAKTK